MQTVASFHPALLKRSNVRSVRFKDTVLFGSQEG